MRCIAVALAIAGAAPTLAIAQTEAPTARAPPPQDAPATPAAAAPAAPVLSPEQIDQLTAPIALYPDSLVAQVLIASTYPLEVVLAERWVSVPENAALKGEQLATALQDQTWDPAVKSLVPYPQVLKMMSDRLDWTQKLGDAFLAQQADVMTSVQRLRKLAQDSGTLKSTEQQTVVVKQDSVTHRETVIIQPANPQVVYVPSYNPTVVYGTWPYPAYPPPPYYPPPPAYYPGYYPGAALASGMAFGLGVAAIASLSDCCNSDWGGNNVNISADRYNNINANNIRNGRTSQLSSNTTNWRHDATHRGGVAYRDSATRQTYQGQAGRQGAAASREARGYSGTRGAQAGTRQAANRPAAGAAAGQRPAGGVRQASAAGGAGAARANAGGAARPNAGAASRASGAGFSGAGAAAGANRASRRPSAFSGVNNGAQVRAQADRGRASQQSFRANASSRSGGFSGGGGGRAGGGGRGGRR
jgi:Protein of unknown function (DUF3300)